MAEKLLGIKQVADWLGVTTRTVQAYANEADPKLRLNGVLLGNRWRFTEQEVENFLERRRKYGAAERKPEEPAVA